ncbi:uncharacterized protein LOC120418507 [Culex pipiens pallens]|uniref:uncharacterized protein LOC120418507 n=1 Tax=Culex pipiens pallens TaxID=42434 RepID=UPI001954C095|nr:uncharacterized protein LOC120418507 [Culex pipiens pallens]
MYFVTQLTVVASLAIICSILHMAHAISCKEVFDKKNEIQDCCSAPTYLNTEGLKECFEENKDKEKREMFACSLECFFKRYQVLEDDGEVSKEKMLAKVEGFEGEWKQTSTKMIEECFAKYDGLKAKYGDGGKKESCNPSSSFMNMCLSKKFIEYCPAEHWNDSDLCNKIRSGECEPKKGKGKPE